MKQWETSYLGMPAQRSMRVSELLICSYGSRGEHLFPSTGMQAGRMGRCLEKCGEHGTGSGFKGSAWRLWDWASIQYFEASSA
jgi:hypothetical protein